MCEAIERNETDFTANRVPSKARSPRGDSSTSTGKRKAVTELPFFCTHHGKNRNHNSDTCYALLKQKHAIKVPPTAGKFNPKKFRKEIYAIGTKTDRKAILDQYSAVINAERKKLPKPTAKRRKKTRIVESSSSGSDSDSVQSHNHIEGPELSTDDPDEQTDVEQKIISILEDELSDDATVVTPEDYGTVEVIKRFKKLGTASKLKGKIPRK